jgi:hypothetical protein
MLIANLCWCIRMLMLKCACAYLCTCLAAQKHYCFCHWLILPSFSCGTSPANLTRSPRLSRRPLIDPSIVLKAIAVTGTATYTSNQSNINAISEIGYTVSFTGTPTGTLSVQVSNDFNPSDPIVNNRPLNSGTWVSIPLQYFNGTSLITATAIPVTAGGSYYLDVVGISAAWIQLIYTNASGSGTITATVAGKVS